MQPHSNYPELHELETLVHQQRRVVAGEIRIIRERRALEAEIEKALRTAGVEAVTCRTHLGMFEVRRLSPGTAATTRAWHRWTRRPRGRGPRHR